MESQYINNDIRDEPSDPNHATEPIFEPSATLNAETEYNFEISSLPDLFSTVENQIELPQLVPSDNLVVESGEETVQHSSNNYPLILTDSLAENNDIQPQFSSNAPEVQNYDSLLQIAELNCSAATINFKLALEYNREDNLRETEDENETILHYFGLYSNSSSSAAKNSLKFCELDFPIVPSTSEIKEINVHNETSDQMPQFSSNTAELVKNYDNLLPITELNLSKTITFELSSKHNCESNSTESVAATSSREETENRVDENERILHCNLYSNLPAYPVENNINFRELDFPIVPLTSEVEEIINDNDDFEISILSPINCSPRTISSISDYLSSIENNSAASTEIMEANAENCNNDEFSIYSLHSTVDDELLSIADDLSSLNTPPTSPFPNADPDFFTLNDTSTNTETQQASHLLYSTRYFINHDESDGEPSHKTRILDRSDSDSN